MWTRMSSGVGGGENRPYPNFTTLSAYRRDKELDALETVVDNM